jgi:hypothetical protein
MQIQGLQAKFMTYRVVVNLSMVWYGMIEQSSFKKCFWEGGLNFHLYV